MQDLYDDSIDDETFTQSEAIQERVQKMLVAMLMENSDE
jgi:hypothetical protein